MSRVPYERDYTEQIDRGSMPTGYIPLTPTWQPCGWCTWLLRGAVVSVILLTALALWTFV